MLPRASACQNRLYEMSDMRTRRHQVKPLALAIAIAIPMSSDGEGGLNYSAAVLSMDISLFTKWIVCNSQSGYPGHLWIASLWCEF